uniref:RNA helicase n=1 Tax=Phallusia mammillata TaxID=59560 RepID=A0A6F9DBI6_9ASCI|nr:ATP-dependent RNA helicase DDX54 [Phallusia mammillata]
MGVDHAESQVKQSNITELVSLVDDVGYTSEAELDTRKLVSQVNRKKKKSGGFQSMGLSHLIYKGIIKKGYKVPTPIQRKCIPLIMDDKDVVAMARTGSGKTAAFLIPLFEKLQTRQSTIGARGLLLAPTRELALQTMKFFKELGRFTTLKAACILGGDKMDDQFAALHENPDVIVATPGRLMHVLVEMELRLSCVQYVVFDEADRLFELGFHEHLHEILKRLPEDRQTLLFSATLPKQLIEFAKAGLNDPTLVRLDVDSKLSDQLKLAFLHCRFEDKLPVLLHLLRNVFSETEQTVVFVPTKHHVEYIKEVLLQFEIVCSYVYSSLDQTARIINLSKFRNKTTMILLVTDVAARGLDIPMLDNVVNYSFPSKSKLFVHRVGRVARAGRTGTAYSIVCPDELPYVIDLHLFLGRPLSFVNPNENYQAWDSLYGSVAQVVIDEERSTLASIAKNSELQALQKVSENAYKQYYKSRPAAASESIKRTKEILISTKIGIHPIYGDVIDSSESARLELLSNVKKYKPTSTIFEIGATTKSTGAAVMKKTRKRNIKFVDKYKEKIKTLKDDVTLHNNISKGSQHSEMDDEDKVTEEELKDVFARVIKPSSTGFMEKKKFKKRRQNFRDEQFFIGYTPKDHHTESGLSVASGQVSFAKEASNVSLDLMGDEDVQLRKQRAQKKVWDRKRKKFVNAQDVGPAKKKIKTESGRVISATYKKNIYAEWKKKTKFDERDGQGEVDGKEDWRGGRCRNKRFQKKAGGFQNKSSSDNYENGGKFGRPGRGKSANHGGKQGKVRSELKRPEQILKARKQTKQKQKLKQKRRPRNTRKR